MNSKKPSFQQGDHVRVLWFGSSHFRQIVEFCYDQGFGWACVRPPGDIMSPSFSVPMDSLRRLDTAPASELVKALEEVAA